jgi:peptide/nickel transport system substrate-binding protein
MRRSPMLLVVTLALALAPFVAARPGLAAGTLRYGMQDDPDALDPAQGGTYSGRVVFAALCDKLIDTNQHMQFVPQLATSWTWSPNGLSLTLTLRPDVHFQDGTLLDAAAVKTNLERYLHAPYSVRKGELGPLTAVTVIDPHTVRLTLSRPYAPLLAVLADRAGMMLSPTALAREGKKIALHPVCAGPFQFVERVAQDHITLERFGGYWNAKAIHLDRIIYRMIPNAAVRLENLEAGSLDVVEQIPPPDVAGMLRHPDLQLISSPALAYATISFNLAHGPAANTPLGQDPRVRQALALAIDRQALNKVVFNGEFIPNNQTEVPHSTYWDPAFPVKPGDTEAAKKLLAAAGHPSVAFTLLTDNTPTDAEVGQVIQSMTAPAGFHITLRPMEANAEVAAAYAGNYQAALVFWSGRSDPDFNLSIWLDCHGFENWGHYCPEHFETLLTDARSTTDTAARQALYNKVVAAYLQDVPHLFLYNLRWLWGATKRMQGYTPVPDGLFRPEGITLAQ